MTACFEKKASVLFCHPHGQCVSVSLLTCDVMLALLQSHSPLLLQRQTDLLEPETDLQSLGSTSWLFDPRDSSRPSSSTKYETTIFWSRARSDPACRPESTLRPATLVPRAFSLWFVASLRARLLSGVGPVPSRSCLRFPPDFHLSAEPTHERRVTSLL